MLVKLDPDLIAELAKEEKNHAVFGYREVFLQCR